jgi:hypothetical protein
MNIDGLVYLLNQAGVALAEASQRIAELEQQLTNP